MKTKKGRKFIVMMGTSPEAQGGIATVVRNYQDSGLLNDWGVRYLVTHVQGSGFAKLRVALVALFILMSMLLTNRVALLHVHMSLRASTWRKSVYLLAAMAFRVPCLIHVHRGDYFEFFEKECGAAKQRFVRLLFDQATRVIALSTSSVADIRRIAPNADSVVLYNSVPLPDLGGRLQHKRAKASDVDHSILFLGRIGERKGAFDLIQAASLLNGSFKLVLGGNGELEKAQTMVKELGLEANVDFPGWVRGTEKDELLARARIFVLPSYHEGIPMAILEAMSWSVPVVTTPVGGIPEVVTSGREGLLVPPGNVPELAQALNRLLADPQLCEDMGKAGRKRIECEYSQEVLLPQLEKLWIAAGASAPTYSGGTREHG